MSSVTNAAVSVFVAFITMPCVSGDVMKSITHAFGRSEGTVAPPVDVSLQPDCPSTNVSWEIVHKLHTSDLQTHVSCHRTLLQDALRPHLHQQVALAPTQDVQILDLSRQLLTYSQALLSRCQFITAGMATVNITAVVAAAASVDDLFQRLHGLERSIRESYIGLTECIIVFDPQIDYAEAGKPDLEDLMVQLQSTQDALLDGIMSAVRQAHQLASTLQQSGHALACAPDLLKGLRDFALEASATSDPDADADFALATHLSESVVAGSNVQCFGETAATNGPLARDAEGSLVPIGIVRVEDMLLRAEAESMQIDQSKRSLSRAVRLYEHANYLGRHGGFESAAQWRYAAAASLAIGNGQPQIAAQMLARFSGYLVAHSQRREALVQADAALALYSDEPLAQYLQVSLRLTSGYFRDSASVRAAARTIQLLAGRLPSASHESERKSWAAELALWDAALDSSGTWSQCFEFYDIAKFMICITCKLLLAVS